MPCTQTQNSVAKLCLSSIFNFWVFWYYYACILWLLQTVYQTVMVTMTRAWGQNITFNSNIQSKVPFRSVGIKLTLLTQNGNMAQYGSAFYLNIHDFNIKYLMVVSIYGHNFNFRLGWQCQNSNNSTLLLSCSGRWCCIEVHYIERCYMICIMQSTANIFNNRRV